MDLFAISAGNGPALAQAYEALVAGLPEGDAEAVTGFALTLCMNALGTHFAIPASGAVAVLPFSPLLPSPPAVWRSKGEGGWGGEAT